jgi:hypothetical protein
MVRPGGCPVVATGARRGGEDEEIMSEVIAELPQDGALTDIVMLVIYEGETRMEVGPVTDLAEILRHRCYGDVSIEFGQLQALGLDGKLTDVTARVEGAGEYDDNDCAYPKVTVTFPDGHEESAWYQIDGRA